MKISMRQLRKTIRRTLLEAITQGFPEARKVADMMCSGDRQQYEKGKALGEKLNLWSFCDDRPYGGTDIRFDATLYGEETLQHFLDAIEASPNAKLVHRSRKTGVHGMGRKYKIGFNVWIELSPAEKAAANRSWRDGLI